MIYRGAFWITIAFAAATGFAAPTLARGALVCLAASKPSDASKPLGDIETLEFYADEGDPLQSYSVPLTRVQSQPDDSGRIHNAYSVRNPRAIGATIVFSGETPLFFNVVELRRTYKNLSKNDEETKFMADAVPGIACYSVMIESEPL